MPETGVEIMRERLVTAVNDSDLFRVVIRTFALLEDLLEQQIVSMLAEPLERLDSAAFGHKLNLAIGLGIVPPEARAPLAALATLRNKLAHGDREPETVSIEEGEQLLRGLDPRETLVAREPLRGTPINLVRAALVAAYVSIETGGTVALAVREREREALRREIAAERAASPLLRSLMRRDRQTVTEETGAHDEPSDAR